MRSNKGFRARPTNGNADETIKKPVKLAPNRKSGKDKHLIYGDFEQEDVTEDLTQILKKRESVYDYFDYMEDEEDIDYDQVEDLLEDEWEEDRDMDNNVEEFPLRAQEIEDF